MTEIRIRPEQVSPADATRILAFLNAAQTAAQIADAVEITDEPDIGLGVAQRILDARAALGGTFTSLAQVDAVKYVGPERFTELVLTLTGPPGLPTVSLYGQLLAEVAALRASVQALQAGGGPRYRVTLRSLAPGPYLGQPVPLVARVTDVLGEDVQINLPVQIATTWGKLQLPGQEHVDLGNSVTVRTGIDGTARVTLLPPTSEMVTEREQAALETMLSLLDPQADTPQAAAESLNELSRHYDWATNVQFRRAVDIYLHDFRPKLLDTLNEHNYMQVWRYFETLVIVYAQDQAPDAGGGSPVQGSAVSSIHYRDWLGPFLQTYMGRAAQANGLKAALDKEVKKGGMSTGLISGIYEQVNRFVGSRYGAIGQYVGHKVATESLREFLDTGIAELPLAVRYNLAPAVQQASKTLQVTSAKILENVGQAQTTVQNQLGTQLHEVDQATRSFVGTQFDKVQGQLEAKVDANTFDATIAETVDKQTFAEYEGWVQGQLEAKVDASTFDATIAETVDRQTFEAYTGEVKAQLEAKVDTGTFDAAIAETIDRQTFEEYAGGVKSQLGAKVDTTTFDAAIAETIDRQTFEAYTGEVEAQLKAKVDTGTFDAAIAETIDRRTFEEYAGRVKAQLGAKVDTTIFDAAIAERIDRKTFEAYVGQVKAQLDSKVDTKTFNAALAETIAKEAFAEYVDNVRRQLSALGVNLVDIFSAVNVRPPIPLEIINPPKEGEPVIIGGSPLMPPIVDPSG